MLLTKSKYILGLECPKHFWISMHHPEQLKQPTPAVEFRFKEGEAVGKLARTLFSGIDVYDKDHAKNIELTRKALDEKRPLFEPGFIFEDCYARADILVPVGDEWDLIEVKSSTEVKDVHVHDAAFQRHVFTANGIPIRKSMIMHINNQYVRHGALEVDKLFATKDITADVSKELPMIKERVAKLFEIIALKEPPRPGIFLKKLFKGYHDCVEECFALPDNNVFCLTRGEKVASELFQIGITHIKDIPKHVRLSEKQKIQWDCEVNDKVHVDNLKIAAFLDKVKYPLYFMDFETFFTVIPLFDGLKPYSQVPFQFSLHVVEKDNVSKHFAFLYSGNSDPRIEFASQLQKVIGSTGTVLVYNQSFEFGRLKELGMSDWVSNVMSRMLDLYVPFREFSYYNPKQQGSASLKSVLPALTGKTYDNMTISDGMTASIEFYKMAYGDVSQEEKARIREDLLKYCEMDTLAEVMIVEGLKEIVREKILLK